MLLTKIVFILPLLVAATSGQANSGIGYYGSSNVRDQRPIHPQPLYGRRPLPLPGRTMPWRRPAAAAPALEPAAAVPAAAAPASPATPPPAAPAEVTLAPASAPVIAAAPAIPAAPSYAPNLRPNPGLRPPLYTPGYRPLLPSHPKPVRLSTPAPESTQPVPVREPVAIPEPAPVSKPTPIPQPIEPSVVAEREPILQPAPEPEPISEQEPEPAPVPEPAPEPTLEPAAETAPEPVPVPVPEPAPVPASEPAPQPDAETPLEPAPEPLPAPAQEPAPEPALEPAPEPAPEPVPEPTPEPALVPAPEPLPAPMPEPAPVAALVPVPEPLPAPVAVAASVPLPEPEQVSEKLPEQELVPISAAAPPISLTPVAPAGPSIAVAPTTKPGALPPLLPKRKPIREPVFGRQPIPSTTAMIYHPTPSYPPSSVATPAPVVITTHSYPPVTRPSGTLQDDFQCKEINGYYPIENECDIYIECKQGRAMKYSCPDGLHFNPAAKHFEYPCAYPSEVKCLAGAKNQSPKPSDKCPNQYGFYSMNDGDCSKFIMCQEGLATIMDCPMGLVFNTQTSSCDWPANVPQCNPNVFKDFKCPEPPQNHDGQESDIIYKYRYGVQCKLYVACQHGHPRLLSCERGLSFDESSKSCINEDYVTDCAVPYSSLT